MNYKGFEITTKRIDGTSKKCWDGSAVIPGSADSRLVSMYQYTESEVVDQLKRHIDYWTRPCAGVKREELEAMYLAVTAENERLKSLLAEWVAPMDGMDADEFVANVAARIKETRQTLETEAVKS